MTTLKSKYDSLDEIPETIDVAQLYEERDGEYVLKRNSIEGVKTDADITRLQNALIKERDLRKTAETTISLFPGSPEEIASEIEALKTQGKEPGQAHLREVELLKQDLNKQSTKVGELQGVIGAQKLRSSFITEASSQGVTTSALEDVLLWGEKLFTVRDGEVVRVDENNMQSPAEWLSDIKSAGNKDYWFEQSQGAGAKGAKGGASAIGVEYFTKGTSNLTKMSAIFKEDKDKAERLAKLAGHDSFDAAIRAHK